MLKDLESKVSSLTGVAERAIDSLKICLNSIHSEDLIESISNKNDVHAIDIFEGTVYIKVDSDTNEISFKFIPNVAFKNTISETVISGESALVKQLDKRVINAFNSIYKDFV